MSTNIHANCDKGCTHAPQITKLYPTSFRPKPVTHKNKPLFLDTLAHENQKTYNALLIRGRGKWNSYNIAFQMIRYAEENKSLIDLDSYWDSYHCNGTLFQDENGKMTTNYCKKRWCVICNRIRTGIMWNKYAPILTDLPLKFVTLTTHFTNYCTTQADLDFARKLYLKAIKNIMRKLQKKVGKVIAIRKTEVTYEPRESLNGEKSFHLHYHFLIDDTHNSAELLRTLWCEYFSEKKFKEFVANKKKNNKYYAREKYDIINNKINPYATYYAQDIRVADNKDFAETFKYLCKTHTDIFNEDTQEHETQLAYEPRIMDIIFFVFKNKKVVQTYNLPEVEIEDFDVEQATIFVDEKHELRVWKWKQELRTWCDIENGQKLTSGTFLSKNNLKYNLLNNSS